MPANRQTGNRNPGYDPQWLREQWEAAFLMIPEGRQERFLERLPATPEGRKRAWKREGEYAALLRAHNLVPSAMVQVRSSPRGHDIYLIVGQTS